MTETAASTVAGSSPPPRRIAVEEAFATTDLLQAWRDVLHRGSHGDPGFAALFGPVLNKEKTSRLLSDLTDIGSGRTQTMNLAGVDVQVLSVAAPGVQAFEADLGSSWARTLNDVLADAVYGGAGRFAGLAALAPQQPNVAAHELDRAVTQLGLCGAIVNSHTQGEYLDDSKFWCIFEAAEALDVPIYLHPNTPAPKMVAPYLAYGLEGPTWGFAAETSLHALRLIMSGVFDRFPRLKIVLGHLGEGIPYWLNRIDSRIQLLRSIGRLGSGTLARTPSEYFRENIAITTSGMNWTPEVMYCLTTLGHENMMFAADHPYESLQEAVAQMDRLPASEAQLSAIYSGNAERLFRIPKRTPPASTSTLNPY